MFSLCLCEALGSIPNPARNKQDYLIMHFKWADSVTTKGEKRSSRAGDAAQGWLSIRFHPSTLRREKDGKEGKVVLVQRAPVATKGKKHSWGGGRCLWAALEEGARRSPACARPPGPQCGPVPQPEVQCCISGQLGV